jgi:uncharacterized protein (TIGR02145 family)
MKTNKATIGAVLLTALTILFLNCTKNVVDPTPSTFNYSSFTDSRDSKTYKSIKIGNQEWMAENLAFKTESGSWNAGGSDAYGAKFGLLYTWEAAKQAVPAGWHLPTDAEWKELEMTLGMSQTDVDAINFRGTNEGGKLKATSQWSENGNGTNDVGFSALPAGFRSNSGSFFVYTWYGYWWTATENDSSNAWFRLITYSGTKISRNNGFKEDAYSVRCIKN